MGGGGQDLVRVIVPVLQGRCPYGKCTPDPAREDGRLRSVERVDHFGVDAESFHTPDLPPGRERE